MKKKQLKVLKLNKKLVANVSETILAGKAGTCEGPCKGGTSCCNGHTGDICDFELSMSNRFGVCDCDAF
ncbi:MAG: hypothetical protein AAF611_17565 [Bacteroidota bacterium]